MHTYRFVNVEYWGGWGRAQRAPSCSAGGSLRSTASHPIPLFNVDAALLRNFPQVFVTADEQAAETYPPPPSMTLSSVLRASGDTANV